MFLETQKYLQNNKFFSAELVPEEDESRNITEDNRSEQEKAIFSYIHPKASKPANQPMISDLKIFEFTGEKTRRIQILHKALLSIKPTSTDCERAFSIAGQFKTKIRNRLLPTKLDWLLWLKKHFLITKK